MSMAESRERSTSYDTGLEQTEWAYKVATDVLIWMDDLENIVKSSHLLRSMLHSSQPVKKVTASQAENPEGCWSRSFPREKTIERWRRAWKGEMIVKGNGGCRDPYEGIVWLDSGFRRNDGPSPSSILYIPNEPQHEDV